MIDGTTVAENEHGLVRVFKASPELAMEIEQFGTYEHLCRALGIERIADRDVQTLQTRTLEGMSVTDFLRAGYEVRDEDVAANRSVLNGLDTFDGMLLIIRSGAFADRPVTLDGSGEATLVATLREPDADVSFDPLPDPGRQAVEVDAPEAKKPSDAAVGGRVATIALIVMALLVGLMIWIAG